MAAWDGDILLCQFSVVYGAMREEKIQSVVSNKLGSTRFIAGPSTGSEPEGVAAAGVAEQGALFRHIKSPHIGRQLSSGKDCAPIPIANLIDMHPMQLMGIGWVGEIYGIVGDLCPLIVPDIQTIEFEGLPLDNDSNGFPLLPTASVPLISYQSIGRTGIFYAFPADRSMAKWGTIDECRSPCCIGEAGSANNASWGAGGLAATGGVKDLSVLLAGKFRMCLFSY